MRLATSMKSMSDNDVGAPSVTWHTCLGFSPADLICTFANVVPRSVHLFRKHLTAPSKPVNACVRLRPVFSLESGTHFSAAVKLGGLESPSGRAAASAKSASPEVLSGGAALASSASPPSSAAPPSSLPSASLASSASSASSAFFSSVSGDEENLTLFPAGRFVVPASAAGRLKMDLGRRVSLGNFVVAVSVAALGL